MEFGVHEKPCRACVSIEDLMNRAQKLMKNKVDSGKEPTDPSKEPQSPSTSRHIECPADKDELGRSTWKLLHTMSVYYPEKPSEDEKKAAANFMDSLSKTYPCDFCAKDLRKDIKNDPPRLGSREEFAMWMCQLHNKVNRKTGKSEFDCSKVFERWKDGWKTGECDY